MELTSIIIVIVAFVAGCLLTFIFNKYINKNTLSDRIAKLEAENQDVINRLSNERAEFSKKIEDLKKNMSLYWKQQMLNVNDLMKI